MNYIEKLRQIAQEHGGIIQTKVALAHGISKAILAKLCKEEHIQRIMRGQYVLADDMYDEMLSISKNLEKAIFSHETALFLHGISDRTPFEYTITVPTNYTLSPMMKEMCKIYQIKQDLIGLGKTMLKTPTGNLVPAYDLERTICDIVRSRSKVGTETFLYALKAYAANPKKDINKLNTYAKQMRVAKIVRNYLEVLI